MPNRSAKPLGSRPLRWRRLASILALPAAMLAWSGTASAQGWLADRRYSEGAGIRSGDLELHPGIGGEVGYDSNWFLRSNKTGPEISNGAPTKAPADAAIFRLTPSLSISTLGPQRLEGGATRLEPRTIVFRGGVSATGRAFIGKEMEKQHNVAFAADARLDVNSQRPIGFGVFAGWNRVIQPQVLGLPDQSFNRNDVRGGAEIIALPGGGTLDLRGGYQLTATLFEESNGVPYTNLTHEVFFRDRWKFRPRTALFHETSLQFVNYTNADRATNYLNDSTPLRTRLGVNGLITQRLGALLAAGYGATFFANPTAPTTRQYDSFTGQAELTYFLGQGGATEEPEKATLLVSSVALGVARDFQNSYLGNFFNSNRAYARLENWFGGSVLMRLDASVEQLNYPPVFLNATTVAAGLTQATGEFTNYRIRGGAFAEYRVTSSFGINTTIDYVQQLSDTGIPTGGNASNGRPIVFDLNYQRFQAFLGARYFF